MKFTRPSPNTLLLSQIYRVSGHGYHMFILNKYIYVNNK